MSVDPARRGRSGTRPGCHGAQWGQGAWSTGDLLDPAEAAPPRPNHWSHRKGDSPAERRARPCRRRAQVVPAAAWEKHYTWNPAHHVHHPNQPTAVQCETNTRKHFSRKHGGSHCSGEGRCLKQDTSSTNHRGQGQESATAKADNRRLKGVERPQCGRRPCNTCSRQRPLTQDTTNSSCKAARRRQCPAGKETKD